MAKKQTYMGNMITTGVGNMVGVGMIGATAGMVNNLPAGMGKDMAGMVPGLQGVAMLGPNIKMVNDSMGGFSSGTRTRRRVSRKRR